MHVQLFYTCCCIACKAMELLIAKIKPDYPGMKLTRFDMAKHRKVAAKYGLRSAPGVAINGLLVARHHLRDRELHRNLTLAPNGRT